MEYERQLVRSYADIHKKFYSPKIVPKPLPELPSEPVVIPIIESPSVHLPGTAADLRKLGLTSFQVYKIVEIFRKSLLEFVEEEKESPSPKSPLVSTILQMVSKGEGIAISVLKSEQRTKPVIRAKHMMFYLAANYSAASLATIGKIAGGRDHTTIINGRDTMALRRKTDIALDARLWKYEIELGVRKQNPQE